VSEAKVVITAQDRASAVLRGVRSQVETVQAAFTGLASAGAVLAAGALVAGLRSLVGSIDDLADTAQGLGLTAVELSNLRIAAQEAGVGAEQFDGAVTRLNVKISEAAGGAKEAQALFRALGVEVRDAAGNVRPTNDVLADLADKFSGLQDGPAKAALAVEIFGKAGAKLVPLLNGGSEGLKRFSGLTSETVSEAQRLQAELDRSAANWERFKNTLAGAVLPTVNDLIEQFRKLNFELIANALFNPVSGSPLAALKEFNRQVEVTAARQKQLQEALKLGEGAYSNEGRAAQRSAQAVLDTARANATATRAVKEKGEAVNTEYARYVAQLESALLGTQNLTATERVLYDLRSGKLTIQTEQQRQLVLALAEQIDQAKELAEFDRATTEYLKERKAAEEEIYQLTGQADEERKRRLAEQLELMIRLGKVTQEQAEVAVKAIAGIKDETDKSESAAEKFGLTIASSLGEWITSGGKASDFIKALGQDILKLTTQMLILEPLTKAIRGSFGGGAGGDLGSQFGSFFSSLIGSSFAGTFANGGMLGAGQWGIAGEAGPEIVRGPAQVVPNAAGNNITVNVQGNADARTANQIAAAVARQLTIANRRYN
jgi:hypothetical protein